jgi:hypothetical protein
MRRTMTAGLALWLVVAGLALVPAVAAGGSTFAGTWVSIDTDGSTQTLAIGQGATPPVTYQDFYASAACDAAGAQSTHFVATGRAWIDEASMSVEFRNGGCGWRKFGPFGMDLDYHAVSDTLTDDLGVTWYRSH